MTTAAVMDGKPLTITAAWRIYDRLYEDDRVTFVSEPPEVEKRFREKASGRTPSPTVWADAFSRLPRRVRGFWSRLTERLLRGAPAACCLDEGKASEVNETGDQMAGLSF
jgi:hypothetical protein